MQHYDEEIVRLLGATDPQLRSEGLNRIGFERLPNAVAIIANYLYDSDADVRGTAAFNLGVIEDPRAVPILLEFCRNEKDKRACAEGFFALEEYHDPSIANFFVAEIYCAKWSRIPRQEVAKQLRNYDTESSVDALIYLLQQDDDVFVNDYAAESLLTLNRERLRPVWEKALKDKSRRIRKIAVQALRQINKCV